MLWVTIIQAGSIAWVLLLQPGKLAAMGQHGLVLACSNTGVIGWAVLEPLVGANLAGVAMLMGGWRGEEGQTENGGVAEVGHRTIQ
jgi:hypothetical protein